MYIIFSICDGKNTNFSTLYLILAIVIIISFITGIIITFFENKNNKHIISNNNKNDIKDKTNIKNESKNVDILEENKTISSNKTQEIEELEIL